jgi:polar amino acid transport system substrate-binding protein
MTALHNRRDILLGVGGLFVSPLSLAEAVKTPFRIAVSDNYPPFYVVEEGRVGGISVDILRYVVEKQMGIPIAFEAFPWARAQMMVQKNGFDALCTIATPNRLTYTVASVEPVLINNYHLFAHKDNRLLPELRKVTSIKELRELHLTALSYLGSGWSSEHLIDIKLTLAGSFENVMQMLLARRADIMIDGEYNVQNWLSSHKAKGNLNSEDIVMLPHVYDATKFDLLVSKKSGYVGMLPEFNIAMKTFRKTAGYRKIFENYGINSAT